MASARVCIVIATRNPGKLAELRSLFADLPLDWALASELAPDMAPVTEDGRTFERNALKKAHAVADATWMVALADDSGLEVDALGGGPGVLSARFAGERATDAENNAELLRRLESVPDDARTARFRCVLCLVDPYSPHGATTVRAEGVCEGRIARSPRGGGGFGYDPLFILDGDGRTMAELADEEKNRVSHRARAAAALRPRLLELVEEREATTERVSYGGAPPESAPRRK
jgi:XTP/dITP diphosphohydrolase